MAQVVVTVRVCGLVRDESVVEVNGEVWLGDSRKAVVRYPGPPVALRAAADRVIAGNRVLAAGQRLVIQERPVEVTLEVLAVGGFALAPPPMPDRRLMVATAGILLLAVWLDQVGAFVRDQPQVVAGLVALVAPPVTPGVAPPPADARWVGEVTVTPPGDSARLRLAAEGRAEETSGGSPVIDDGRGARPLAPDSSR